MITEHKTLALLKQYKSKFKAMGRLAHREGEWLKSYSFEILNYLDLLDQMPLSYHGQNTECSKLIFDTGQILTGLGDYFTAIEVFQRLSSRTLATKNFAQAGQAFNAIGLTYNQLNLFDQAEVSFGWALRIYQKQLQDELGAALTLNNYAVSLIQIHCWSEAEEKFQIVLKNIMKLPEKLLQDRFAQSKMDVVASIHINLGKLYLFMAQEAAANDSPKASLAEKSCTQYHEAIELHQDQSLKIEAESGFAEALNYMGKHEEAEKQLKHLEQKCLENRSTNKRHLTGIYRRLAVIKMNCGELDHALDYCYQALETSLLHANLAEEMEVIHAFLKVLKATTTTIFHNVQDHKERVRIAHVQGQKLIDHLVGFLEKKDLYTGLNHSYNVCQLSIRMGEIIEAQPALFGLVDREDDPENSIHIETLSVAGILHDIGKLLIPWSVINKILPLREEEWRLIKQHPMNGYRILNSFQLDEVGKIVAEHHEKVNGTGYPWGRTRISLMGAIIALADVYEAMTTINRLYRQAKTKEVALAELNNLAGIHYDPRAVRALNIAMT